MGLAVWTATKALSQRRAAELPALDFAGLIGPAGWQRLAPPIRDRFAAKPSPGRPIRYAGTMHQVECSAIGWLIGQACRILGTPFAPHRGAHVPVTITLRALDAGRAIEWERAYHYSDHPTAIVRSEKRATPDGQLIEQVGAGFGMRLGVFEAEGALHFRSEDYFWQWGSWRLPLPGWLSPGTAEITHEDLGAGRFRFVMTIHHQRLGMLFHQDGVFHEEGTAP
jgi:hypothetical protein